jgi:hypothetical protein
MIGVIAVVAFAPIGTIIWDGGFSDEEYRLTFQRPDGSRVPGVTLRVETLAGGICYFYPVNEFLPDSTPTSGADGTMVFHHVAGAVEFSGRDSVSVIGFPLRRDRAPQYDCVFLLDGREIHRLRFDSIRLRGDYEQAQTVSRTWKHPDWPVREYLAHHERWESRRLELFDGNRDGRLDREERIAAHYFESGTDNFQLEEDRVEEEIVFAVREHTIVIAPIRDQPSHAGAIVRRPSDRPVTAVRHIAANISPAQPL